MVAFVALLIGYVMGAKAGSKDLDQVVDSLKRLAESDEFADVVSSLRSHVGHTMRELGSMIDDSGRLDGVETGDLVDRVHHLVVREG